MLKRLYRQPDDPTERVDDDDLYDADEDPRNEYNPDRDDDDDDEKRSNDGSHRDKGPHPSALR